MKLTLKVRDYEDGYSFEVRKVGTRTWQYVISSTSRWFREQGIKPGTVVVSTVKMANAVIMVDVHKYLCEEGLNRFFGRCPKTLYVKQTK